MDRYTARINLHGTTQRERTKNRLKKSLIDRLPNSLSHKDVVINGVESQLIINSGTQPYYKEFQSLPDQEINIGDYIEWANSHWIVVTCDYDDEIYRDGKLEQCNYLLKWQNEHGEIIERWAVIRSASKYNDGLAENKVITLGSDKLSIVIPLDTEALKLNKAMSKKFFIDYNKDDPTTYLLANAGNVPDTYNGHGVTSWIVEECAYTASEDDLKYGVCDYTHPSSTTDEPPVGEDVAPETGVEVTIKGNKTLKVGFARTYTANITGDENDNIPVWDDGFSWTVPDVTGVVSTVDGDKVKLLVESEDLVDEYITLSVCFNGTVVESINIKIEGAF